MELVERSLAVQLRELAERYAVGLDRADPELFESAFLPDGSLVVHWPAADPSDDSDRRDGHGVIRQTIDSLRSRYTNTMHFLGQTFYERGSDGPVGVVYCVAHHIANGESGSTNFVMHLRYHDRYALGAGGRWGIAERHARCEWSETRPVDPPIAARR